jgi:hypothetical protein
MSRPSGAMKAGSPIGAPANLKEAMNFSKGSKDVSETFLFR